MLHKCGCYPTISRFQDGPEYLPGQRRSPVRFLRGGTTFFSYCTPPSLRRMRLGTKANTLFLHRRRDTKSRRTSTLAIHHEHGEYHFTSGSSWGRGLEKRSRLLSRVSCRLKQPTAFRRHEASSCLVRSSSVPCAQPPALRAWCSRRILDSINSRLWLFGRT